MLQQTCCSGRKLTGTINPKSTNDALKSREEPWVTGLAATPAGQVPLVADRLSFRDRLGSCKARWGIGRMDYLIHPGLYGIGRPDEQSPVLVTANYKMTFDRLRGALPGISAWILVLDTKGINVWCAAGKGTFGTAELVRRLRAVNLQQVVSHRSIILPQLGAPGIKAHEVTRQTGFKVVFGPVRADDLPAFLAAGQVAAPAMRLVRFTFRDRLVLTPIELVSSIKPALVTLGILFLLQATGFGHYGLADLLALAGAILAGCVLTPLLLPVIPGRLFAVKGAIVGLIWAVGLNLLSGWPSFTAAPIAALSLTAAPITAAWLKSLAYFLIIPAISAFEAMNFTGCTTYTSLSGVNREMRLVLLPMLITALTGVVLLLAGDLVWLIA